MKKRPHPQLAERLKTVLARRQKKLDAESAVSGDLPPIPAGVLVPLYQKDSEYYVIFTLRTDLVEHHKGQISFPGGAYHPGDENLLDTALRESHEEIELWPADVEIVGELDDLITVSGFHITPYVGFIPYPYTLHGNKAEVAEIIHVPLPWLLDKRHFRQGVYRGGITGYYYDYQGYTIWGVTARILKPFLDLIEAEGLYGRS